MDSEKDVRVHYIDSSDSALNGRFFIKACKEKVEEAIDECKNDATVFVLLDPPDISLNPDHKLHRAAAAAIAYGISRGGYTFNKAFGVMRAKVAELYSPPAICINIGFQISFYKLEQQLCVKKGD